MWSEASPSYGNGVGTGAGKVGKPRMCFQHDHLTHAVKRKSEATFCDRCIGTGGAGGMQRGPTCYILLGSPQDFNLGDPCSKKRESGSYENIQHIPGTVSFR